MMAYAVGGPHEECRTHRLRGLVDACPLDTVAASERNGGIRRSRPGARPHFARTLGFTSGSHSSMRMLPPALDPALMLPHHVEVVAREAFELPTYEVQIEPVVVDS